MAILEEGIKAPLFSAEDQNGKTINLEDFRGQKVVLYFYPKDDTPGCTAEACNLRDNYRALLEEGFAVIGISPDDLKSHRKFSEKYELPFPLIPDPDKKILEAYGVWGEKKMYGKTFMGVTRTTYVIDQEGIIEKVIKKVQTKDHTSQIFKLYQ